MLGLIGYIGWLTYSNVGLLLSISIFFFSFIPMVIPFALTLRRSTQSIDFPERTSRTILYVGSILSIFTGGVLIINLYSALYLHLTVSIFFINLLIAFILNFRWKISVHSTAIATAGYYLLLLNFLNAAGPASNLIGLLFLFIILPYVSWARYHLNIHTIREVIGGIALGFLLTTFTAIFFLF